jgi:glycosyltransferase involved in cell wall biosynthesis
MDKPLVSVCVPSLGRPEKLDRLLKLIPETAEWPHEVIVKYDEWPPFNLGCPTVLSECVAEAKGDFVAFTGNDCVPQQGWLRIAMEAMQKWFPEMDGLIGLADGYWHGELALHWVGSRKLLPMLGGNFFHPGYKHICCDSELTERCRQANKYVFCEEAKVYHDHPIQTGFKPEDVNTDPVYRLAYDPESNARDRALLEARSKEFGFPIRQNFSRPRIPRKAFTFWLGDTPMPPLVENCIASQREFTKGWEYKVVTLEDIPRGIAYVEAALAAKRWVKAVDFFKLFYLYNYGGVYFDADVELLKPIPDEFRTDRLFAGLEWNGWVGNGVIGAEPKHPVLGQCLQIVQTKFRGDDDKNFESSVQVLTETIYGMGPAEHGVKLYNSDVFTPYNHQDKWERFTDQTVAYHHFMVSWGYPQVHPCVDLRPRLGDVADKKVLNVGIGPGESGLAIQLPALQCAQLDHVEVYQPYIDKAKRKFWVSKKVNFYCADVRSFPVEDYDVVLLADVLEHIPKDDALALLERCKNKVVVFGPLEKTLQNHREGVEEDIPSQDHVSLWQESDFIDLGFRTELLPDFHQEKGESWPSVWAVRQAGGKGEAR